MSEPACKHTEHRHDRATNRWIGFDPRVNEWQPCPEHPRYVRRSKW